MAYEFTKQKIAAERRALLRRLVVSGIVGAIGFGIGAAVNDLQTIYGAIGASLLAVACGGACFYLV